MAREDKSDSLGSKIDALAAMAGGEDISHEGFNAIEEPVAGESDAAAALASRAPPAAPPAAGGVSMSASRKARVSAMQRQRARVHAEQFKRMMVPILIVTGALLLILGSIVAFMMRSAADGYTGAGMLHDPGFKRIMVITSFPLGAILLVGAWLFRADLKRAEAAEQRENEQE